MDKTVCECDAERGLTKKMRDYQLRDDAFDYRRDIVEKQVITLSEILKTKLEALY